MYVCPLNRDIYIYIYKEVWRSYSFLFWLWTKLERKKKRLKKREGSLESDVFNTEFTVGSKI